MELSEFPDKYLGVVLNPGRVKVHQDWCVVEMMQEMLASWKGTLLAFPSRLTLVKFVLCSYPVYTMSVYKWPKVVIQECEKIIRNFLWTGDPSEKKLVTVKWEEINALSIEGGLGLRRLEVINKALLMKLLWRILTEDEEWTQFMKAKFMNKKGEWTQSYKQSSIWPGLKWVIQDINAGSRWIVGNGKDISIWSDKWVYEYTLIDKYPDNTFIQQHIDWKVEKLIQNGKWCVPIELQQILKMEDLPQIGNGDDTRVWGADLTGKFSVANATNHIRVKYPMVQWEKQVCDPSLHPYVSLNVWKMLRGACATEESVRKRGFSTVSKCYLCGNAQDNMEHIVWQCKFSGSIWHWLCGLFNVTAPNNFEEMRNMMKTRSSIIQ